MGGIVPLQCSDNTPEPKPVEMDGSLDNDDIAIEPFQIDRKKTQHVVYAKLKASKNL